MIQINYLHGSKQDMVHKAGPFTLPFTTPGSWQTVFNMWPRYKKPNKNKCYCDSVRPSNR